MIDAKATGGSFAHRVAAKFQVMRPASQAGPAPARLGRKADLTLDASPGNPVPAGGTIVGVTAAGGVGLRAVFWPPRHGKPARGTICLLPGWAASIEKYFETVDDLRSRGFVVASLDWRGQGKSERALADPRKLHVGDFADYDRDLDAFYDQVVLRYCPAPYAALAHSMGGMICLRGAHARPGRFTRLALAAPMLGLGFWAEGTPVARLMAKTAVAFGLGDSSPPFQEPFSADKLPFWFQTTTGDRARFRRSAELLRAVPETAVGSTTFGWLNAAFEAMSAARRPGFAEGIGLPVLLAQGTRDMVVSGAAISRLAKRLPDCREVTYKGARHDVLLERDAIRDDFFAAFDAFMAEDN